MTNFIEYLRARIKTIVWICYGLLTLIAVFSFYFDTSHAHTWAEQHIPFFWSFFGFGAAAVIIGFTRWFGRSGIQARTDYYESSESSSNEDA